MALTSAKRRTNNYYWCVEYTDENGMISEAGNAATMGELTEWVVANLENLPKGEGKFTRKKA